MKVCVRAAYIHYLCSVLFERTNLLFSYLISYDTTLERV